MVSEIGKTALQNIGEWGKFDAEVGKNTVVGKSGDDIFKSLFTDEVIDDTGKTMVERTEEFANYWLHQASQPDKEGIIRVLRKLVDKMLQSMDKSIHIPKPYAMKNGKKNEKGTMTYPKEEREKALPNENAMNKVRGTIRQFFPEANVGKCTNQDFIRFDFREVLSKPDGE